MPLRKLCWSDQVVNTRSTEFIGSVHYLSQKFVASTAGLPGSDVYHNIILILPGGEHNNKKSNQCTSILVHAAIQPHDVEDLGSNLFYRIIGTVQPWDLVFPVQRFHLSNLHPALAH